MSNQTRRKRVKQLLRGVPNHAIRTEEFKRLRKHRKALRDIPRVK
jgi:hypothetical protein